MPLLLDRLVLKGPHRDIRAVVLPPAFPAAPFSVYVLGPIVPDLDLLFGAGIVKPKRQMIVGTSPGWRSVRALIEHTSIPFYVPDGDTFVPVPLDFGELPEESPFDMPGCGWLVLSNAIGCERAVRRGPVMRGNDGGFSHPYSYAVTGRPAADRGFFVNLGAVPGFPVEPFRDVNLAPHLPALSAVELEHPHGFIAACN